MAGSMNALHTLKAWSFVEVGANHCDNPSFFIKSQHIDCTKRPCTALWRLSFHVDLHKGLIAILRYCFCTCKSSCLPGLQAV